MEYIIQKQRISYSTERTWRYHSILNADGEIVSKEEIIDKVWSRVLPVMNL